MDQSVKGMFVLKTLRITTLLALMVGSQAHAQEVRHATADEFSRLMVTSMKNEAARKHPAMATCVNKMGDSALSDIVQSVMAGTVPAADIETLDAFFGSSLGARWTDNILLAAETGVAPSGAFTQDEADQIKRIISMPSYLKLEEATEFTEPTIRKAVMKALDPCQ